MKQMFDKLYENTTLDDLTILKEGFDVFIDKENYEKKLFSHLGFL